MGGVNLQLSLHPQYHDWGVLEQGTEPTIHPRAPQQKWLPTAPGVCSWRVCLHCCVCALWMAKCRAWILSMGHHIWPCVTFTFTCVCFTAYILHRWKLLWFTLKTHKYSYQTICNNRQSNSEHIIKTVTHTCVLRHYCWIQYSQHSIVFQFQSFWKFCFELCLVCKRIRGKMKWTKDQVLTDVVWNFIKYKVHPLFPNVGIRRKAMQRQFFCTTWHCASSCCIQSDL